MSGLNRYAKYDTMSTEALEEILRQDFLLPSDEDSDIDAILYISQLIADRETDSSADPIPNVDDSWNSFKKNFIVSTDTDLNEDKTISRTDSPAPAPKKKSISRTLRILLIAAVITAVLAGATYAAGILGWLPDWNRDHFSFAPVEESSSTDDCTTLEEALARHNAPPNIVPRYLPDGYEQVEFTYTSIPGAYTTFSCAYSDGTNSLQLSYTVFHTDNHRIFTKDDGQPDVYTAGGIDHYIVTNNDQYKTIWQNENFECSLSGFKNRDELIRSIDSMY